MTKGEELYLQGALEEAMPFLLKEAKEKNGRSMYILAQYFLQGLGTCRAHPAEAGAWFGKGAACDPLCVIGAAFFRKDQEEAKDDIARAYEEVKALAGAGDVVAMVCAAYACRGIAGVIPADSAQRMAYLTMAAEAHFWQAANDLGLIYLNGRETAQDKEKGFALLSEAASFGIGPSEYHLAFCLLHGEGTAPNPHRAISCYQKAWRHGYGKAAIELGMQYETGTIVKQDEKKAFQLYKRAAESGFAEAKAHLGDCYYDGKGVKRDARRAAALYAEADRQGDSYGALRLGQTAMAEKDFGKAFFQFYKAARQGLPVAQYLTGLCLVRGIGVAANAEAGMKWLRQAAERGSREALDEIAKLGR